MINDKILFFGNTFDAKFHHKHWIIVNNYIENLKGFKLPYYKIGTDPILVENFHEKTLKIASNIEDKTLYYRRYVAPIGFELALKAYYKLLEWRDDFDEMLYSNLLKGIESVESGGSI